MEDSVLRISTTYEIRGMRAMKRLEEAAEAYEKAVSLQPGSSESQLNLGFAWADLDETELARDLIRPAGPQRPSLDWTA